MKIYLNDYYDTKCEEIDLEKFYIMMKPSTKDDTKFFINHSNDDIGYIEIPFNLGMAILSLLTPYSAVTINIYPDIPDAYDFGYEIRIDF